MAKERLSMRKIKEILRLHYELGLGKKPIARACSLSPSTVVDYIRRAEAAGLRWPLPDDLDETSIEARLFPTARYQRISDRPLPPMEETRRELCKKGVTLQLLWMEYKEKYPEGYQYSQFCEHFRRWQKTLDLTLRQEYRAGEKMFLDFAGKGIPVVNPATGETKDVEIFVAVLGASNYTYAEAVESQNLPSWIGAHVRAFEYFDGVTEILVPDNLRSGVTKSSRYEPDINPTYLDMCQHYGTVVIPARVSRPRDKAKVEAGVLLVTRWITAALRHHTFFSIAEVNERIKELLERLNTRKFKKLDTSRKELFETIEKPSLKPLPVARYEYAEWKKATANIDYHIEVDGHFYSVPYQLVRKQVEVRLTSTVVEILYQGRRVATHQRSYQKGKFTTLHEHRPKAHQRYLEWTPSRLIAWAEHAGPATAKLVEMIMSSKPHPEQGFRSCLGIISLGKKYSSERLEAASRRALHIRAYSYRSMKSILKSNLDRVALPEQKEVSTVIEHENIRGERYFT
jgi:transposase